MRRRPGPGVLCRDARPSWPLPAVHGLLRRNVACPPAPLVPSPVAAQLLFCFIVTIGAPPPRLMPSRTRRHNAHKAQYKIVVTEGGTRSIQFACTVVGHVLEQRTSTQRNAIEPPRLRQHHHRLVLLLAAAWRACSRSNSLSGAAHHPTQPSIHTPTRPVCTHTQRRRPGRRPTCKPTAARDPAGTAQRCSKDEGEEA